MRPIPEQMRLRPARALIGWRSPKEAVLDLAGRLPERSGDPALLRRAAEARAAVQARSEPFDQEGVLELDPAGLEAHRRALLQQPAARQFLEEDGWQLAVVDLARLVAVQALIHTGHAEERCQGAEGLDLIGLARLTVPATAPEPVPFRYDPVRMAYVISSDNPNLQVTGEFHAPVSPGVTGFGFLVEEAVSYLQVARSRGRLLLRDGYHRAYGLLARGVRRVPVLFRDFAHQVPPLPAGLFDEEVLLGAAPPTLRDYHDDRVSAELMLPTVRKLLVLQALELDSLE